MNCEEAQQIIQELLDGELEGRDRETLDGHLKDCPACRRVLEQYTDMMGGFSWLVEQSRENLGFEQPATRRTLSFPWTWGLVGAAAAAVLLVAIGLRFAGVPELSPDVIELAQLQTDQPISERPESHFEFQLVGESHNNYIAVQQKSSNPRVHMVLLYETVKKTKRSSEIDSTSNRTLLARS